MPTVAVAAPSRVENRAGLELPGRLEAYIRAPIYARVPGYLKSWKHDIGSRVKAGDVLAEIDTPDLDQQLMQARAALNVAQANAKSRKSPRSAGSPSPAPMPSPSRTLTSAHSPGTPTVAQVKAAQANVDQLVAEEGFKRLTAPFDGIVTARETDIGALINVGAAAARSCSWSPKRSKLRVYVSVPQNYVPSVPPGTKAMIRVPEHPGKTYRWNVEASAQTVTPDHGNDSDANHRRQRRGGVAAGRLCEHPSADRRMPNVLSVPSSALIFDAKGLSIATVGADDTVLLKPVSLQRDLGAVVELASGLAPDDQVIQNPPDGIGNGDQVRIARAPVGATAADAKPRTRREEPG